MYCFIKESVMKWQIFKRIFFSVFSVFIVCIGYASVIVDENGIEFVIVSEEDLTCKVVGGPNQVEVRIEGPLLYNNKYYKVIEIDDGAFKFHDLIKNVYFPSTIEKIGNSAFNGCTNLSIGSLPNSITFIGSYSFLNCTSLQSMSCPMSLTHIGSYAFSGCSNLLYVDLWENIETIGSYAFSGCSSLKSVHLPPRINNIDIGTFKGCSSLLVISFPNTLTSIGVNAFEDCERLNEMHFPDSLETIGSGALDGCENLTYLEIPSGVDLRSAITKSCAGITSLKFKEGKNTTVGGQLSYKLPNLKTVLFSEGITEITDYIFSDCESLESISFSNTIRCIDRHAFSGCIKLERLKLPQDLNTIGWGAFSNCTNLCEIDFPENLERIGSFAFSDCISLTDVKLPDNVKLLEQGAFKECSNLKNIYTGKFLEVIENEVFENCGLHTVVLGESLKNVSSWAFGYCPIKEIYLKAVQPPQIVFMTFSIDTYSDAVLHVPSGCVDVYKMNQDWGRFYNIISGKTLISYEDEIFFEVENRNLIIKGYIEENIEIFNSNGISIYRGLNNTIELPHKGLFVVRIGRRVFKIII